MNEELPPVEPAHVPTTPFYLVWNERGRAPSHKHSTFKGAVNEAQRLARENAGTFAVLAVVATAQMTTLETEHFLFDPTDEPPPAHPRGCDCLKCEDEIPF